MAIWKEGEQDTLTIDNRLDLCDFQDILEILRPKVRYTQRSPFERAVFYQSFQDGPELADLALVRDRRSMNQQQVRRRSQLVQGFLDVGPNGFGVGLDIYDCQRSSYFSKEVWRRTTRD